MNFCPQCNNILYPKERKTEKVLNHHCMNCAYEERAKDGMIYRHKVQHSAAERTAVVTDVISDPTLPRTKEVVCPKCSNQEAVFFQSTSRNDAEAMTLYYVCTNCGDRWRD
eukprot:CAMPEP_0198235392 /NCGR_PEP_ID=MMETSP1446-20131203/1289_1 /TAXON_ID=1461542 ORGANISM="Unidentified sp, Strain CCMP2111" /NCGR_SAMPLE_ID=MMETSP1446 /ASSEMBLY_ACC=CAM_ASM_001112 /LENGTH=110 /DNA_ID=CAMNT_0043916533 /DNA_START=34 /DNA_END=366 /DNA_ORIENTATION=+